MPGTAQGKKILVKKYINLCLQGAYVPAGGGGEAERKQHKPVTYILNGERC